MRLLLSLFALVALGGAISCYTHPDVISVRNRKVLNFPEAISECKADAICGVVKLSTTSRRMCTPNCPVRNGCQGTLCCCDSDLCNKDIEAMRRNRREVSDFPTNSSLELALNNETSFSKDKVPEASEVAPILNNSGPVQEDLVLSMNSSMARDDLEDIEKFVGELGTSSNASDSSESQIKVLEELQAPSNTTNSLESSPKEVHNASEPAVIQPKIEKVSEASEAASNASDDSTVKIHNSSQSVAVFPELQKVLETFESVSNLSEAINALPKVENAVEASRILSNASEILKAFENAQVFESLKSYMNASEVNVEAKLRIQLLTNKTINPGNELYNATLPEDVVARGTKVAAEVSTKANKTSVEVVREPWMQEPNVSSIPSDGFHSSKNEVITGSLPTNASEDHLSSNASDVVSEVEAPKTVPGFIGSDVHESNDTVKETVETLPEFRLDNTEESDINKTSGSKILNHEPPKTAKVSQSNPETTAAPTHVPVETNETISTLEDNERLPETLQVTLVAKVNASDSDVPEANVNVPEVDGDITASKNNETFSEAAPETEVVTTTTEDPVYVVDVTGFFGKWGKYFGRNETEAELKAGNGTEAKTSSSTGTGGLALLFAATLTLIV